MSTVRLDGLVQKVIPTVCACSVTQLCLTLCNPMNCSPPGSSVHRIFQARILEWVAISYSRASFPPRDQTPVSFVSCTDRQILHHNATLEALGGTELSGMCPGPTAGIKELR